MLDGDYEAKRFTIHYNDRVIYVLKLHIHVLDVVSDIALDLVPILYISEGRTQPIGAHEYEKLTS